ncbi:NAD(P)/FAD-dependent oxidoreductase [Ferruginivarius sediminum]|uniref:FAD-binding oxidoreductase n=1 Tax=Ferruginivarius sediminum TaxID=2661937 RepID=A0A369TER4_9PROT|nr:FAD-binding oxidoreductase [Ferruginivarius sediminum]RDD63839.1 FAD-binding oxidoreductase [Ferruginivarius sediminum]
MAPQADSQIKLSPYWWEAAPPGASSDRPLPDHVDFVVVGSGYCGLNAAIELARAGASVAVLEAQRLGEWASTRNAGMVTAGHKFLVSGALDRFPREMAQRVLTESRCSFDHVKTLIDEEGIDCDYARSGRVILADAAQHKSKLEKWAGLFPEATGMSARVIEGDDLHTEIGSQYYPAGLLIEDYASLHPAKYHKGLRSRAVRAGAALYSGVRVDRLEDQSNGVLVHTSSGGVRADRVVVATNGYGGAMMRSLRNGVIPVASYMVATERLSPDLTSRLSPKNRMFSDTKRDTYYFRLSPDGERVLFGARPFPWDVPVARAARRLRTLMARIWPELANVRLAHAWTCKTGMTFDRFPHVGQQGRISFAVGCNGSGVAMNSYLGHRLARSLTGHEEESVFQQLSMPTSPLYFGRPWFLPFVAGWMRGQDILERNFSLRR